MHRRAYIEFLSATTVRITTEFRQRVVDLSKLKRGYNCVNLISLKTEDNNKKYDNPGFCLERNSGTVNGHPIFQIEHKQSPTKKWEDLGVISLGVFIWGNIWRNKEEKTNCGLFKTYIKE